MLARLSPVSMPSAWATKPRFSSKAPAPEKPKSPFTEANRFLPDPAQLLKGITEMRTLGFRDKFQAVLDEAKKHLQGLLKTTPAEKLAVVMDLDETLLDNSAYELAKLLKQKPKEYLYHDWNKSGQSPAIPESLNFVKWVMRKKMPLFFVTSRIHDFRQGTIENLRRIGIPESKYTLHTKPSEQLGKKGTSNSFKVGVQQELVNQGYTIGAMIGDQQTDVDGALGKGFLLPNLMYTSH